MGILLAILLLALYGVAIVAIVRAPFRALGVLVAGMAFHNIVLMALLRLGTPGLIIRAVQFWKEGILILLGVMVLERALHVERRPRLAPMDLVAGAFAGLLLIYLFIPASLLHSPVGFTKRVVGFRQLILIPLLY